MNARRRGGFTIVELLTVLAILSLLVALLAPAVQQARESARSLTCKSRLRALVTAVLQYEGVHGMLPMCTYASDSVYSNSTPAIQTQLLPFLENESMYLLINFEVSIHSTIRLSNELALVSATVSNSPIAAFVCPSDGQSRQFSGAVSYRACVGVGPISHRTATFPDSDNGVFPYFRFPVTLSMVLDGMSCSAAFSERLIGSKAPTINPTVRDAYMQDGVEALGIHTADDQIRVCGTLGPAGNFGVYWSMGSSWLASGQDNTLYTHAMSPNSGVVDCIMIGFVPPVGCASARSMHRQKVNVAFLDGSVRSISNSISLAVWRGLGTRDGGEIVLGSEF